MNKQSIIGLILIFVVLMGYAYIKSPSVEEREAAMQQQKEHYQRMMDSIERAAALSDQEATSLRSDSAPAETALSAIQSDLQNPFSLAKEGEKKYFEVENEVVKVKFSNRGGRIASIYLKDYLNYAKDSLFLMEEERTDFYLTFFANNRNIKTDELYFESILPEKTFVEAQDSLQVVFRAYTSQWNPETEALAVNTDQYIEFVYTIKGNEYMIDFDVRFVHLENLIAVNTSYIDLVWNAKIKQLEKAATVEQNNTGIYYKPLHDDVDNTRLTGNDEERLSTPTRWISFSQQFFSTTLIAKDNFVNADLKNVSYKTPVDGNIEEMTATLGLEYSPEGISQIPLQIYAGPNKYKILRSYDLDLERQIPIGWGFFLMHWINRFAVIPIFNLLENWHVNYGIIILILTILLKLVLFPLTFKSYISSAKMRVIQPEVAEINKKYPKQEQAMDKQRAIMTLYKKAGISPMAGCIPMLVQFPILIAMFRFFPASIELRQQPFLWADDLSSYDSILNLPFNIPFYGDHVSLFALLMAVSNLLYTRMTMKQQAASNTMPGMKFMMYAMPIMFLGLLNSYSCALNYYYFLSTIITFLQMWIIRRSINDEKVHAIIQENKKKPVKKSKFQARLEAMARQQQELARQQQNKRR